MQAEHKDQIRELFEQALGLSAAERADYLSRACLGDGALRDEVERLLRAHARAADFLERPALQAAGLVKTEADTRQGTVARVGPYRLLGEIGRGGMGVVYLAERADGEFRQQVAVKLIWPGPDSEEVIRRFRRERQILADLDHPNIARLLDGGTTEDGWPYLVMEYIAGRPVAEYCEAKRLGLKERLRLFQAVCGAVAYAHRKHVVHRDIKPSNVLVTDAGEVKLLDFGVAKVLGPPQHPEPPAATGTGLRLLTPEYASPEQVRGEEVTGASDVYSLGVVLYELLTGRPPHRLRRLPLHEVLRVVSEEDPPRPSAVVAQPPEEGGSPPHTLQTPDLGRRLRGDLDNILLKALERDPRRRYASVADFSADVARHLAGEAVVARNDSRPYRARKFIRRHRVALTIILLLSLLLIGSGFLIRRQARRERWLNYVAHLRQAGQDWADGNLANMGELLARHAPGSGDEEWRGPEWHLLRNLLHRERAALRHDSEVGALAFSPDGKRLFTGSRDGKIEDWEAATGRRLGVFAEQGEWVFSLSLSRDGGLLAAGGQRGLVRVWEAAGGRLVREIRGHGGEGVNDVALSPDGRTLATGSRDKTAKLWEVATGRLLLTVREQTGVEGVRFSPDGKLLAVTCGEPTVRLWDTSALRQVASLDYPTTGGPGTSGTLSPVFSPDGRLLAGGGRDSLLRVWDVQSRKLLHALAGHADRVGAVQFAPDGRTIFTGGSDHTVRLWDAAAGREKAAIKCVGEVLWLALAPDGRALAGAFTDTRTTLLWDVKDLLTPSVIGPAAGRVNAVAFSPDGRTLAAGEDGALELWDWHTGAKFAEHRPLPGSVLAVEFSPDGKLLAASLNYAPFVELRGAATGHVITALSGHTKLAFAAAFSPDGRTLATASDDLTLRLWDVATRRERMAIRGHANALRRVAFSPDGRLVASGAFDNTAKVWDAATGELKLTLGGHAGAVQSVRFSPDGRMLATGSRDFAAKLWDARTGRELRTLGGHGNVVNQVAFSADGRRLVTASFDRTVRLWDTETGAELLALKDHDERVWAVAFAPDGQTFASGGWDKTVRLWRTASAGR